MPNPRTYNFRYVEEREAFFADLVADFEKAAAELGTVKASSLRTIFEFQEFSETERIQQESRFRRVGANSFRGMRTFTSLETVFRFLFSRARGGSGVNWRREMGAPTRAQFKQLSELLSTARVNLSLIKPQAEIPPEMRDQLLTVSNAVQSMQEIMQKAKAGETMFASIRRYVRKQGRIIGEETFAVYRIENHQIS